MKTKTLLTENNEMTKNIPPSPLLVACWNQQPNLRGHTDTNSKVYRNSIELLDILLGGKFKESCPLNELCIEINNISDEELEKEWSYEEIEQAIERFNYMMSDSHIADKRYFPKNLPDFIYNFRTQHSFIFSVLGEDREVFGREIKCLDDSVLQLYQKELFRFHEYNINDLIKNVNYIIRQQRDFEERIGKYCFFHPLKEKNFYNLHSDYILLLYSGKNEFSPKYIGPYTFQSFIEWLKEKHNISFYISHKENYELKEKYERDKEELERIKAEEEKILEERKKWACSMGLKGFHKKVE